MAGGGKAATVAVGIRDRSNKYYLSGFSRFQAEITLVVRLGRYLGFQEGYDKKLGTQDHLHFQEISFFQKKNRTPIFCLQFLFMKIITMQKNCTKNDCQNEKKLREKLT